MSFILGHDINIEIHSFDPILYHELEHIFNNHETVIHCYTILNNYIFGDIKMKSQNKDFEDYINRYFTKFFSKVLRNFLLIGWCPYVIKKIKDVITGKEVIIPEVVSLNYIYPQLTVDKKKFEYKLEFLDVNDRITKLKHIKYFALCELSDLANNRVIYSTVQSFLNEYRYVEHMKKFHIQGEFVRSNPQVFLKAAQKSNNEATIDSELEQDDLMDSYNRKLPEKVDLLKDASRDVASHVEFHNRQMADMFRDRDANYYNTSMSFRQQTTNNLFICPPGLELASQVRLPDTRTDVTSIAKKLSSNIYLLMNVPETIFGFGSHINISSNGRTANRSTEVRKDINIMDVNSFDSSLENYRFKFKELFVKVYKEIYNKEIKLSAVTFDDPKTYRDYKKWMLTTMNEEHAKIHEKPKEKEKPKEEKPKEKPKEEEQKKRPAEDDKKDEKDSKKQKNI